MSIQLLEHNFKYIYWKVINLSRTCYIWDTARANWHVQLHPEKTTDIWRRYHWFPTKWRLRKKKRRNSILMTCHYPDLGGASDWLKQISHATRPIRSTTEIWVVTPHQFGISALVSQTSFGGKTIGSVAKCRLFSQTSTAWTTQKNE